MNAKTKTKKHSSLSLSLSPSFSLTSTGTPLILIWTSYMDGPNASPTHRATSTASMMGTTACSAPAPSTASTMTATVMRVTPHRAAAAKRRPVRK